MIIKQSLMEMCLHGKWNIIQLIKKNMINHLIIWTTAHDISWSMKCREQGQNQMDRTPISVILEVLFSRTSGQRHRVLSLVGVAPRSSDHGFVNADRRLLREGLAQ